MSGAVPDVTPTEAKLRPQLCTAEGGRQTRPQEVAWKAVRCTACSRQLPDAERDASGAVVRQ